MLKKYNNSFMFIQMLDIFTDDVNIKLLLFLVRYTVLKDEVAKM